MNVLIAECLGEHWTGAHPRKTRFVDANKGENAQSNYRARLAAIELKAGSLSLEMFAAMPPLEARICLFSLSATRCMKGSDASPYRFGVDVESSMHRRLISTLLRGKFIYIYIYTFA